MKHTICWSIYVPGTVWLTTGVQSLISVCLNLFFLFSEREIGFNLYRVHIGGVLVYMLLHLRVFKACTLCAGLNIAVPEQDLTALKGAAWLASHIICQAYKGTFLL